VSVLGRKSTLSVVQQKCIQELILQDVTGKTIAEIAEELGTSERSIYRWKNDPVFVQELEKQADIHLKGFLHESYAVLKNIVRNGRSEQAVINAVKLVMQSQGKLRDVQEVETTVKHDIASEGLTEENLEYLESLLED
jgi:predicted transcriptional regulator